MRGLDYSASSIFDTEASPNFSRVESMVVGVLGSVIKFDVEDFVEEDFDRDDFE